MSLGGVRESGWDPWEEEIEYAVRAAVLALEPATLGELRGSLWTTPTDPDMQWLPPEPPTLLDVGELDDVEGLRS